MRIYVHPDLSDQLPVRVLDRRHRHAFTSQTFRQRRNKKVPVSDQKLSRLHCKLRDSMKKEEVSGLD